MVQARENVEVLYALMDEKGTYSKFAGTSICSLFENTREKVRVHIFHDGSIKGENRKNFETLARRYGQEIVFYNARNLCQEVWQEAEKIKEKAVKDVRYTEAALYRLLAPQILPEDISRIIYLDADTMVHIDIRELWQEDIGDNGMAAVFEQDMLRYYGMRGKEKGEEAQKLLAYWQTLGVDIKDGFNSGVLMMDLQRIRPMGNLLLKGLEVALDCDSESNFYDQNILNFYFAEKAYHLPWKYNILQHWDRKYKKSREVKGIYHYMGRSLGMDEHDVRDTLFYDYFLQTPWATGRFLCHFHEELKKIHNLSYDRYLKKTHILLTALMTKKLAIAASNAYLQKIRETLGRAEAKSDQSLGISFCNLGDDNKLNLALPYDVDEYFYLFIVEEYVKLKVMLEQAGLPEQNYYMDGRFLLDKDVLEEYVSLSRFFAML